MAEHPYEDDNPELREKAERARQKYKEGRQFTNGHDRADARGVSTTLKTGSFDMLEKVKWAWPGYLAYGKFHILGGQKGAGKSTIAFDLLAQITVGGKFPDGTPAPLGDVMIWSGEDDFNDTILPRIVAAGGDVTRVHWPDITTTVDGVKRSFNPALDVDPLRELARGLPDLKGLLIDPVVSASLGDSHKNAETRIGLQPLVDLGGEREIILIGITHFSKGTEGRDPIERITGSLAFGAIPRVVLGAAKGANEDAPRKLVRIASNIGPSGGGFEYLLMQELLPGLDFTGQRVLWGKQLTGSPLELLGDSEAQTKKLNAVVFLNDMLAGGAQVKVKELKSAAEAHGLSWRTVERAKTEIGNIVAEQSERGWHWQKNVGGLREL